MGTGSPPEVSGPLRNDQLDVWGIADSGATGHRPGGEPQPVAHCAELNEGLGFAGLPQIDLWD